MIQRLTYLFLCMLVTVAQAEDIRIGVIDARRVFRESALAAQARAQLSHTADTCNVKVQQIEAQRRQLLRQLEEENLSAQEQQKIKRTLSFLEQALQRIIVDRDETMDTQRQATFIVLNQAIKQAAQQVAERDNLDLILLEDVYHSPSIDITDRIIPLLPAH